MKTQERLNAAQVRQLPAGTQVIWHGRDRSGWSTQLACTVVQSGRSKKLAYTDVDGLTETKPIRDLPNKYFTMV